VVAWRRTRLDQRLVSAPDCAARVAAFARLVPLGELSAGVALIAGFWTPLFAFVAFFMALNFQIASGAIFRYSFLTSGYGLPVLGSTLALAIGRPLRKS
jgi:uncharacterized membrane protein YphA (DoxX/SURF4 family)